MSKNKETEPNIENRPSVPILTTGIGTRISAASDLIGTRKKAASIAGITPDQLARYIREENQPRLGPMAALCRAAGIHLEWLTTGEGPKMAGASIGEVRETAAYYSNSASRNSSGTVIDAEVLEDVLVVLRSHQDRAGRRFAPRNEARLVAEIYQYLIEQEQPAAEDRSRVLRLIDTIIGGTNAEPSRTPGDD